MQQQVLALPGRDDFHELGVLDFLDLGVDGDEGLAEGLDAQPTPYSPVGIRIAGRPSLAQHPWLADGRLKKAEHIVPGGLEVAERALVDLYRGVNMGKMIVEVKKPDQARM